MGRGENVLLLLLLVATKAWNLPRATKHGTFQGPPSNGTFQGPPNMEPFKGHQVMEPSKGHQTWNLPKVTKQWNLPRATKHWNLPVAIKLRSSFTSFFLLFFKKVNSDHWGSLSPDIILNSNLENTCSHNLVAYEKND